MSEQEIDTSTERVLEIADEMELILMYRAAYLLRALVKDRDKLAAHIKAIEIDFMADYGFDTRIPNTTDDQ